MQRSSVERLARVLWVAVTVVFVCNIIALFWVPGLVVLRTWSWYGGTGVSDPLAVLFSGWHLMTWAMIWSDSHSYEPLLLVVFLLFCGICTAVILWQARRVLGTVCARTPFCKENGVAMNKAAVCCFLISGVALIRAVCGIVYYRSAMPLLNYNALFVPLFLMGGLLCMVMSALFRQAAEIKAENDLTV